MQGDTRENDDGQDNADRPWAASSCTLRTERLVRCATSAGRTRGSGIGYSPEPHPRPAPVLLDELDAGGFQGGTDGGEGAGVRLACLAFKVGDRLFGNLRCSDKIVLRPVHQGSGSSYLGG